MSEMCYTNKQQFSVSPVVNNCNMTSSASFQDARSVRDNSKHESSADPNPNATTCYIQYVMV